MTGLNRLAALALVLAVVAAVSVTAAAQTPWQAQQGTGLSVRVEKSVFKLYVYPDGSVQPYYLLKLTLLSKEPLGVSGHVYFNSRSVFQGRSSHSKASLDIYLTGVEGESSRGNASLTVSYRSSGGGNGEAKASGVFYYEKPPKSVTVEIRSARLTVENGETARLELDVVVPSSYVPPNAAHASPEEINRELARSGIGYIRVEDISVAGAGGRTEIRLVVSEDLAAALRAAVANGMPSGDASKLASYLKAPYRVEGSVKLHGFYRVEAGKLIARLAYESSESGDLQEMGELLQRATPLMVEALTYLLKPLAENNPQLGLVLTQLQLGLRRGAQPLVPVAPSVANTTLRIEISGSRASLYLETYGGRVRVASREAPSVVAEKTLTVIAMQLQQSLQGLGMLQAYLPGIATAIPTHVELVPVDGVKVSQRRTTLTGLATVRVEAPGTPTPAPSPTPAPPTTQAPQATGTQSPAAPATQPATTPQQYTPPQTTASPAGAGQPAAGGAATATAAPGGGATVSTATAIMVIAVVLVVVAVAVAIILRRR